MCAPVIYSFGTAEQKEKHLPSILNSDVWWCQGYSEPGSGSDLASLKTKAELVVIDTKKEWVFKENDIFSKSQNTPFLNQKFKGRINFTIHKNILFG